MSQALPFLTARWQNLLMLNYEIDPALIRKRVPAGTEIDFWNGRTFVSLVGFQFLGTRLRGWHVPLHTNFDEVNLRFYVRHKSGNEWRRGVAFIKEIVPRWAIAQVARWAYNEQYVSLKMRSRVEPPCDANQRQGFIQYAWKWAGGWNDVSARISGQPSPLQEGSEEEFITEHYWGYAAQRDGSTLEYQVEHPSWRVWRGEECRFSGDVSTLYGPEFSSLLASAPSSAFVADGSEIIVRHGRPTRIAQQAP